VAKVSKKKPYSPRAFPGVQFSGRTNAFFFSYSPKEQKLLSASQNIAEVLGTVSSYLMGEGDIFLRYVHPDDRFQLLTDLDQTLDTDVPLRSTYRWVRPDNGQVRLLHARASLVRKKSESFLQGVILDVSDELHAGFEWRPHLLPLLSQLEATFVLIDPENRITWRSHPSIPIGKDDTVNVEEGKDFLEYISPSLRQKTSQLLEKARAGTIQPKQMRETAVFRSLEEATVSAEGYLFLRYSGMPETTRKVSRNISLLPLGAMISIRNSLDAISQELTNEKRGRPSKENIESARQRAREALALTTQFLSRSSASTDATLPVDLTFVSLAVVNELRRENISIEFSPAGSTLVMTNPRLTVDVIQRMVRTLHRRAPQSTVRFDTGRRGEQGVLSLYVEGASLDLLLELHTNTDEMAVEVREGVIEVLFPLLQAEKEAFHRPMTGRVVIVENDVFVQSTIRSLIGEMGFETEVRQTQGFLTSPLGPDVSALLLSTSPGDSSLVEEFRKRYPEIPIVALCLSPDQARILRAAGATRVLRKPVDAKSLRDSLVAVVGNSGQ
jgi:CheY-like chemotaxis protein